MAYPSDAQLMVKKTRFVNKVWTYMKEHVTFLADVIPTVDVKAVKAKAKAYWFRDRQHTEATPSLCKISGTNPLPRSVTCGNILGSPEFPW